MDEKIPVFCKVKSFVSGGSPSGLFSGCNLGLLGRINEKCLNCTEFGGIGKAIIEIGEKQEGELKNG